MSILATTHPTYKCGSCKLAAADAETMARVTGSRGATMTRSTDVDEHIATFDRSEHYDSDGRYLGEDER